jgi:general L-amino acid transport system substrate-binding protein
MARTTRPRHLLVALLALTLIGSACSDDDDEPNASDEGEQTDEAAGDDGGEEPSGDGLLAEVRDRGTLNCGVNNAVPGFGVVDDAGEFSGFDIDFCKVIAAAVLGDAEAVEYVPLTAEQRFTSLAAGEIDVLVRNTTRTASREGTENAAFTATTFYDGQGMMVTAESGIGGLDDMDGATVCVLSGTTTEQNLASVFNARGMSFEPLTFDEVDQIREAILQGQCDGWTSDRSQLAGLRSAWPAAEGGPDGLVIFDDIISKEPLGPAVRDGDDEWFDAVNWAVMSTILAEELGITSENITEQLESEDPTVQAFLGQPVGDPPAVGDTGLNLEPDFAVTVITEVGNYGEIFERNVGVDTALGLERGLNALWNADEPGLLYAPPYR